MTIGKAKHRPLLLTKAVIVGFVVTATTLGISQQVSASQLQDAKAQVSALTNTIDQLRIQIQSASIHYQDTETQLLQTQSDISALQGQISAKREEMKVLRKKVTAEAVHLFIQGGSIPSWFVVVQGNPSSIEVVQEDVSTASSIQQQAVIQYQLAQNQLKVKVQSLHSLENRQQSMVSAAQNYQAKVQSDIMQAQSQLSSASSQVQALVAQQEQQRILAAQQAAAQAAAQQAAQQAAAQQAAQQAAAQQAAQQAAAQQAAAQQAAAQQAAAQAAGSSDPPPVQSTGSSNPSPPVAPSGYANPLRAISGLSSERVDQGVDYNGSGPIYALGDGVVLNIYNSGWPNGVYISYRLTNGPAAGDVVYVAESVNPTVTPGQSVTPNTVIGTLYNGSSGIETGWANPGGNGTTMAAIYGQFYGANSTAFGYNFSQLLSSLGGPGGVLQNNPPTGSVPSNWPQW